MQALTACSCDASRRRRDLGAGQAQQVNGGRRLWRRERVQHGQMTQRGAQKIVAAMTQPIGHLAGQFRRRVTGDHQVVGHRSQALRHQLHRGVRGHQAVRSAADQQHRAGAAADKHAAQVDRACVQQQHIGPRRGAAQRLEKTSQRRAAVEVVQRQATRGQVRDLGRQGLDAGRQVNRGKFMRRRRRVSRVHHQRVQPLLGKRRAKPLHHHTGIADLRVVDQRHEAQPAGGSLRRCRLTTVAPRHRARDRAGPALVPHQLAQTFGLVTE